ncbi:MAG: transposase [Saprospiraceae bacterium]|nr:transposase [Saprospiraceae bacterium]
MQNYKIQISMAENGESIGKRYCRKSKWHIKGRIFETYNIENIKEAKALLITVIGLYNEERPHMSIGNLTANQIHLSNTPN